MRTFIAIELSDPVREALMQAQSHLRYAGADVKWVEKQNIHLTLKFLGDISDEKAAQVCAALDAIGRTTKSFELTIKDIGTFPSIDFPKIIWVGLDKGATESTALAGQIEAAMAILGFQEETRPFAAHLTIGRVRSGKNKEVLKEKVGSYQLAAINPQRVQSIILFKSTLTPSGPIYSKLHETNFPS